MILDGRTWMRAEVGRRRLPARLLIGLGLVVGTVHLGCSGETPDDDQVPEVAKETPASAVSSDLMAQSWPVLVAKGDARAPYESGGYVQLTYHRNPRKAVSSFGDDQALGRARAHADAAAIYRQAALTAATAFVETYEPPLAQPYDPAERVHLLMVSKAILGDAEGAKAALAEVQALGDANVAKAWSAPWVAAVEAGTCPSDFSASPFQPPSVAPGQWPTIDDQRPSYTVAERDPGSNTFGVDDPTLLVQLALWHDAASKMAAPGQEKMLELYGARYRLPCEGGVASEDALPLDLMFGSDLLTAGDGAFMAALTGEQGLAAVESFQGKSLIANIAVAARGEGGKIEHQRAVDIANDLRKSWRSLQLEAAGEEHGSHMVFADVAMAALYRDLAFVAELEGDRETSGKLRIAALDMGERHSASTPAGLLSLAAWDADNQYTIRGLDIIHQQARRMPSLEVVRSALDLLAIRVGRSRGSGGTPGM